MRIAIAALFVTSLVAGCLDNDQPKDDQSQQKDDPDDNGPDNGGVGDPGNNAPNAALDNDQAMNAGDPQTAPEQPCHDRIKGTHRCE
jgi:hypothetical protein